MRLQSVEVEKRRVAHPSAPEPLLQASRGGRVAPPFGGLEESEAGPAIVGRGVQTCLERSLSAVCLSSEQQSCS